MTTDQKNKVFLACRQFNERFPWPSETGLRAIIQDAHRRGFSSAFKRYGRRALIDPEEFWECLERQQKNAV